MASVHRPSNLILLVFVLHLLQIIGHCWRLRSDRKLLNGDGRIKVQEQVVVSIEVYDLLKSGKLASMIRGINHVLNPWEWERGVWHTGVNIYGLEWSYGMTMEERTGVFSVPPRQCSDHSWSFTHGLGSINITEAKVETILKGMEPEWMGTDYDLLRKNCGHFTCGFVTKLGLECPAFVTKLANVGANFAESAAKFAKDVQRGVELANQLRVRLADHGPTLLEHLQRGVEQASQLVNIGDSREVKLVDVQASLAKTGANLLETLQWGVEQTQNFVKEKLGDPRVGDLAGYWASLAKNGSSLVKNLEWGFAHPQKAPSELMPSHKGTLGNSDFTTP